jgi:hypothetical protein
VSVLPHLCLAKNFSILNLLGPGIPLHHFALYPGAGGSAQLSQLERERLERLGIPPPPGPPGQPGGPPGSSHPHHPAHAAQLEAAERLALATDPMVRDIVSKAMENCTLRYSKLTIFSMLLPLLPPPNKYQLTNVCVLGALTNGWYITGISRSHPRPYTCPYPSTFTSATTTSPTGGCSSCSCCWIPFTW